MIPLSKKNQKFKKITIFIMAAMKAIQNAIPCFEYTVKVTLNISYSGRAMKEILTI